jgi:hypothetical protein
MHGKLPQEHHTLHHPVAYRRPVSEWRLRITVGHSPKAEMVADAVHAGVLITHDRSMCHAYNPADAVRMALSVARMMDAGYWPYCIEPAYKIELMHPGCGAPMKVGWASLTELDRLRLLDGSADLVALVPATVGPIGDVGSAGCFAFGRFYSQPEMTTYSCQCEDLPPGSYTPMTGGVCCLGVGSAVTLPPQVLATDSPFNEWLPWRRSPRTLYYDAEILRACLDEYQVKSPTAKFASRTARQTIADKYAERRYRLVLERSIESDLLETTAGLLNGRRVLLEERDNMWWSAAVDAVRTFGADLHSRHVWYWRRVFRWTRIATVSLVFVTAAALAFAYTNPLYSLALLPLVWVAVGLCVKKPPPLPAHKIAWHLVPEDLWVFDAEAEHRELMDDGWEKLEQFWLAGLQLPPKRRWYASYWRAAPLSPPSDDVSALVHMVCHRVLRPMAATEEAQEAFLGVLFGHNRFGETMISALWPSDHPYEVDYEEAKEAAVEHDKKQLYLRMIDLVAEEGPELHKMRETNIQMKRNEIHNKTGRALIVCDTTAIVYQAAAVGQVTKNFCVFRLERPIALEGFAFRSWHPVLAIGMTWQDLSAWASMAWDRVRNNGGLFSIHMGDDTYAVFREPGRHGRVVCFGTDYSGFDTTSFYSRVGRRCALNLVLDVLYRGGVPLTAIRSMHNTLVEPWALRYQGLSTRIKLATGMLNTGSRITSLGNTISSVHVMAAALMHMGADFSLERLVALYVAGGFPTTLDGPYESPSRALFLKGQFLPHDGALVWTPLGSILKVGTMLPSTLSTDYPNRPLEVAAAQYMSDCAYSAASMPRNELTDAFIRRFRRVKERDIQLKWHMPQTDAHAPAVTGDYRGFVTGPIEDLVLAIEFEEDVFSHPQMRQLMDALYGTGITDDDIEGTLFTEKNEQY